MMYDWNYGFCEIKASSTLVHAKYEPIVIDI